MKRLTILAITIFLALTAAQAAFAATGNVTGYLGFRALEDEWEPVDTQLQLGGIFDINPNNWPVSLAADLFISVGVEEDEYDDDKGDFADISGAVVELDLGVRKIFNTDSNFSPYIGGGFALATASMERDYFFGPTEDDDDSGIGVWFGGGFYALIGSHFTFGFDVRFSSVEVTLFNEDVNAGGFQMGAMAGYHW